MWKTLYAIGLALPRILFRPTHSFEVVVPQAGKPFATTLVRDRALGKLTHELKVPVVVLREVYRKMRSCDVATDSSKEHRDALQREAEVLRDTVEYATVRIQKLLAATQVELDSLRDREHISRENLHQTRHVLSQILRELRDDCAVWSELTRRTQSMTERLLKELSDEQEAE